MDQLPNLGREQEMLSIMGLNSIDELFSNIPEEVRRKDPLPLPPPQSEEEIWRDAQHLLGGVLPCAQVRPGLRVGLAFAYSRVAMRPEMLAW